MVRGVDSSTPIFVAHRLLGRNGQHSNYRCLNDRRYVTDSHNDDVNKHHSADSYDHHPDHDSEYDVDHGPAGVGFTGRQ